MKTTSKILIAVVMSTLAVCGQTTRDDYAIYTTVIDSVVWAKNPRDMVIFETTEGSAQGELAGRWPKLAKAFNRINRRPALLERRFGPFQTNLAYHLLSRKEYEVMERKGRDLRREAIERKEFRPFGPSFTRDVLNERFPDFYYLCSLSGVARIGSHAMVSIGCSEDHGGDGRHYVLRRRHGKWARVDEIWLSWRM